MTALGRPPRLSGFEMIDWDPNMRRLMLICVLLVLSAPLAAQNTVVRFATDVGHFDVELFDDDAPITVDNFMNYVRRGAFDDSLIHRSILGFVIQGGAFYFDSPQFAAIPRDPAIVNEFGISNERGTIAMAKLSDEPDSATSSWFINTTDNNANGTTDLDTSNGGFTVFGRVLGDGMTVVDLINSIRTESDIPRLGASTSEPLAEQFISMRVIELTDQPSAGFAANQGLTGTWLNGDTPGQGWLIDVWDDGGTLSVFAAWFTYDVETPPADETDGFSSKQHRWLTASGTMTGNVANLQMQLNSGGVFNQSDPTTPSPLGTMTIDFSDCGTAQISWDFDNAAFPDASVNTRRLSPDTFCQEINDGGVAVN